MKEKYYIHEAPYSYWDEPEAPDLIVFYEFADGFGVVTNQVSGDEPEYVPTLRALRAEGAEEVEVPPRLFRSRDIVYALTQQQKRVVREIPSDDCPF